MSDKKLKRAVDILGFSEGVQCVQYREDNIYKLVGRELSHWSKEYNQWHSCEEGVPIWAHLFHELWHPVPDPTAPKERWYRHEYLFEVKEHHWKTEVIYNMDTWDRFLSWVNETIQHISTKELNAPPWETEE